MREGENIWEAKDADGNLFIQSVIRKALATKNGDCDFERYSWRNKGEDHARWKMAAADSLSLVSRLATDVTDSFINCSTLRSARCSTRLSLTPTPPPFR